MGEGGFMGHDEHAIRDLIETWHRATASGELPTIVPEGNKVK